MSAKIKIQIDDASDFTHGGKDAVLDLREDTSSYVEDKKMKEEKVDFSKHEILEEEELESIDKQDIQEAREEEIEESLSEIYHDDKGNMVDVHKLFIKKRHGVLFYLLSVLMVAGVAVGAWFAYGKYGYLLQRTNTDKISLEISAKNKVMAGEELIYDVYYSNNDSVGLKNVNINVVFPDKFILSSSQPVAKTSSSTQNASWMIGDLPAGTKGKIQITGKMIAPVDYIGNIVADMVYTPVNYSGEFKKSANFETDINDVGLDFVFDNYSSLLVGQEGSITVSYKAKEVSYLNNFRMSINFLENMELKNKDKMAKPGSWVVENITKEEQKVDIRFKFKEKINPSEEIGLIFEYNDNGRYYQFMEKKISIEVMKSSLNMNLIINGSRVDQGVDFGQVMNYSVVYANKGETTMRDVVIMAVVNSDFVDWSTLKDTNKGKVKGNSIIWTKDSIPALAELASGQEGTIDFSLNVAQQGTVAAGKSYQVKSYAQFSIGKLGDDATSTEATSTTAVEPDKNEDTRSNTIVNKINSNLELGEKVLYFNEDNIPVGSGPIPPKVGQSTAYRVYWHITNSLHELNDVKVETVLPNNVNFDDKTNVKVGSISYDQVSRKVTWNIGRLPISEYQLDGDFGINIIPTEDDADKILVLLNGTAISAQDVDTSSSIAKTLKSKTTKLDDDEIAASMNNDGQIVR